MSEETGHLQLEALLSDALRPIEPPEDLVSRVESTLTAITEQAAAELSSWAEELSEGEREALRDPRDPGRLRQAQLAKNRHQRFAIVRYSTDENGCIPDGSSKKCRLSTNPNSQHFAPAHNPKMPLIVRMNAPRFRPTVANDVGDTGA